MEIGRAAQSEIALLMVWAARARRKGDPRYERQGNRDALLVLLCGTLGLTADEARHLTVAEVRDRLSKSPWIPGDLRHAATGLLGKVGGSPDSLVFRSAKGKGKKPADRVTLWRILVEANPTGKGSSSPGKGSPILMRLRKIARSLGAVVVMASRKLALLFSSGRPLVPAVVGTGVGRRHPPGDLWLP